MSRHTSRAARRAFSSLVATLVVLVVTGCDATPTPGLSNGSVSACYRAIPTARHAIHNQSATLVGVHRIPADRVRGHLPPSALSRLAGDNDTTVCAVAFHGKFIPGQVDLAPAGKSGVYAIVLVSSKKLKLIDAAILDHLPRFLGKRLV